MELFEKLGHEYKAGKTIRELAREHEVHRAAADGAAGNRQRRTAGAKEGRAHEACSVANHEKLTP